MAVMYLINRIDTSFFQYEMICYTILRMVTIVYRVNKDFIGVNHRFGKFDQFIRAKLKIVGQTCRNDD